ncbi:MAG: hybrid sensor histidine kinase/response regulator, partial [Gemmataceae bacterium]|nr:hybrid sensor histidine kinase/response regulator [Gemmataceae bacterium]
MTTTVAAPPRPDVLIVEDNPDGREALRMLLEAHGYRVESAQDGGEGVEKGVSLHPRFAVVDMGL